MATTMIHKSQPYASDGVISPLQRDSLSAVGTSCGAGEEHAPGVCNLYGRDVCSSKNESRYRFPKFLPNNQLVQLYRSSVGFVG